VVTKSKLLFIALLAGLLSCSGVPFLVPNPPGGKKTETAGPGREETKRSLPPPVSAAGADAIDFAVAFAEDTGGRENVPPAASVEAEKTPLVSGFHNLIVVPGKMIRVALRRNVSRTVLHTSDTMEVHSPSLKIAARCMGRIMVETKGTGYITIIVNDGPPHDVALPCTLTAVRQSNLFDLGEERYRGSLIITGKGVLTLVNHVAVEEYLRGVVPLEMGKRSREEIEALKAQAVAARTYAYKHIGGNKGESFDVLRTIADQVYGGADVETVEADYAVNATRDLVLLWRDSLADVYYHSTCGGRTAGIDEAWGNSYREYLCSRNDIASDGQAYCSFSPAYTWEESWDAGDLSKILSTTAGQTVPDARFGGRLRAIKVEQRFGCGRVKMCRLLGTEGSVACGGDKIRFVLRRKSASGEILRSTNFSVEKNGPDIFMLRGKGYGHGVGMCQMGAIGRSRRGQNFEQILLAYFSPAQIGRIQFAPAR